MKIEFWCTSFGYLSFILWIEITSKFHEFDRDILHEYYTATRSWAQYFNILRAYNSKLSPIFNYSPTIGGSWRLSVLLSTSCSSLFILNALRHRVNSTRRLTTQYCSYQLDEYKQMTFAWRKDSQDTRIL